MTLQLPSVFRFNLNTETSTLSFEHYSVGAPAIYSARKNLNVVDLVAVARCERPWKKSNDLFTVHGNRTGIDTGNGTGTRGP